MTPISSIEQLNLEITWNCNLNCPMCPSQAYPVNKKRYLELGQVEEILSKFSSVTIFNIIGCGEPLLHPQWSEIVSLWRQQGGFNFTTNATLLTREKIMEIPSESSVAISLDTLDPEDYGRIRNADLNQVIDNIKLLRKLQPRIMMFFNVMIMPETIDKLQTLLPLAKQVRAAIHLLYPTTFNEKDHHRFYPEGDIIKRKIRNLKKLAYTRYRVSCVGGEPTPKIRHCNEPFDSATLSVKGEVYSCCYIYSARNDDKTPDYFDEYYDGHGIKVPQHQYLLGNIFTDDIDKFYNCERINHIKEVIHTSGEPKQDFCTLRRNADLTQEHEYCKICGNRWGVMC